MTTLATIDRNRQIKIPSSLGKTFPVGQKIVLWANGNALIIKPLDESPAAHFKRIAASAQADAKRQGLNSVDIELAIKAVRKGKV
jgi:virulence-associated protein VagC